jgi:Zn-dependent protease with chaperone function
MWKYVVLCACAALVGGTTLAVADEDDPSAPATASCQFTLSLDSKGTGRINLTLYGPKSFDLKPKQIENALYPAIGVSLTEVRSQQANMHAMHMLTFTARADDAFPPEDGRLEGSLDLTALGRLVRPLGVRFIVVSVNESEPPRSAPGTRDSYHRAQVSIDDPQPVTFTLGPRRGALTWRGVLLVGLVVGPFALVLFQRRAALRAADPALGWYRFWRWAHWVVLGTWLAWLTLVPALGLDAFVPWGWVGGMSRFLVLRPVAMLLPPWLITVACSAIIQDVFARLSRVPPPPGTIFRRVVASIFTLLLPVLLALIGLFVLAEVGWRAGVLWLGAALALRLIASRLASRGEDLTPYAVTEGDLFNRISELARLAGVTLQQIMVIPTGKMPQANAAAVLGGSVMFTDHLLRNLTRREVDAVAAHELAHLKYRHPGWLVVLFLVAMILPALARPALPHWWQDSWMQHLPVGLMLAMVVYYYVMRRFEFQVDAYAAWLTGDPEAMITGLVKIHRLSLMPMQWGKWEEGMLTHPSTSDRLESIARQNGVSSRRLQEIVGASEGAGEHYSVPERDPGEDTIFSTEFRQKSIFRITWTLILTALLMPALIAAIVWWVGIEGTTRWVVLVGGVLLTSAALAVWNNYLPVRGYPYVRGRLREKLTLQGLDPDAQGGIFVSFAPDRTLRIYEGYTNWDFGYLFLLGDRLCYVGERTRFALSREQIVGVRLGPGMPRWRPVPYLYVDWQDPVRGTSGTFNLRAGDVRSMTELHRMIVVLKERLESWHKEENTTTDVPASLAELSAPDIPKVASIPVRAAVQPAGMIQQAILLVVLGGGLALLLGLPFGLAHGALAWYIPAVAIACLWFGIIPLLCWHRDEEEPKQPSPATKEIPVAEPSHSTEARE